MTRRPRRETLAPWLNDDRAERRRGQAHRGDREPGPAQPRDHRVLLAARRRVRGRGAATARTGARSRPGPRGRPAGRSAARTGSSSSAACSARAAGCCTRSRRSGAGCCGAGCSSRETRLGRLTARAAHAVRRVRARERRGRARQPARSSRRSASSSRAISRCPPDARGRRRAFLDGLRPGDPPDGQRYLRQAFTHYERRRPSATRRARSCRAGEPRDRRCTSRPGCSRRSARRSTRPRRPRISATARSTVVFPGACGRSSGGRPQPSSARRRRGCSAPRARLAREVITDSFLVLALPGRMLALGANLTDAYPEALRSPADADLRELLARSSRPARARRLRRARLVGSRTSGCTTSSTSSARSTIARTCSTRRSARRSSEAWAAACDVPRVDL